MAEEEFSDILSLIMAVYKDPIRYRGIVQTQAELPWDLTAVLRIASGEGRDVQHCPAAPGIDAENLQKAAVFFIEQACFFPEANYYRVLGLLCDADADRIKQHHRLLMRIFHPDRQTSWGAWTDGYARRINQAYNVLRRSDKRRSYDRSLNGLERRSSLKVASKATASYRIGHTAGKPFKSFSRPAFFLLLSRYLTPIVLISSALMALLFVLGVYLSRPQASNVHIDPEPVNEIRVESD